MASLNSAIEQIFLTYLKVNKKDKVLVVIDDNYRKLGNLLYDEAKKYSKEVELIEMSPRKVDGEDPPKIVEDAMMASDVIIGITTKSLTHTKAAHKAADNGAKIASMPGITEDTLKRTLNVDFKKMQELGEKISNLLNGSEHVRVTTKLGTDFVAYIPKRKIEAANGLIDKKGIIDNLPGGEVFFAPVAEKSKGVYWVDGAMGGIGILKEPIEIFVVRGYATEIKGGTDAKKLKERLQNVGPEAFNVAELGIGINQNAKIIGNILEDEKAYGTIHIALGNNKGFGGDVDVPIHLDGIIKDPTIYIDNKEIMREGKFLI